MAFVPPCEGARGWEILTFLLTHAPSDFIMFQNDAPSTPIAMCSDVRGIPTTLPASTGGFIMNGTLGTKSLADYK